MISIASRPRRSEQVLARPGENVMILLNPRGGQYYTLDEVGSRVWALCDGMHTVAEMAASISEEYEAPLAEIEVDVQDLLAELASERLVLEAS